MKNYNSKLKYPQLFPEKIKECKRDERHILFEEKPFNIIEWIHPEIVKEYGAELVIEALNNLKLTYTYLVEHTERSTRHTFTAPSTANNMNRKEQKTYQERASIIPYTVYHFEVPGGIYNGEIIRECMLLKYPELRQFTFPDTVKFNPFDTFNTHTILSEIPAEYRDKTINELMEISAPQEKEVQKSAFFFYDSSKNGKVEEFYLKVSEDQGNDTLYIPWEAFVKRDFKMIEKRMQDYFTNYYRSNPDYLDGWKKVLAHPMTQQFKKVLESLK